MTALDYPTLDGFDPFSPGYLGDPQAFSQRAHRECPVFYYEPLDVWVITRYVDVHQVLTDSATFSSQAWQARPVPPELRQRMPAEHQQIPARIIPHLFINLDPPLHTRERKQAQKAFTRPLVKASEPRVVAVASDLIDGFADAGECDLMRDFAYPFTLFLAGEMIGIPVSKQPELRDWIDDFFSMFAPIGDTDGPAAIPPDEVELRFARFSEAAKFFSRFLDERRALSADDLASAMVTASGEGTDQASDEQLICHLMELIAAGSDTTANLIGHTVRFLTEEPEQAAEIVANPALWEQAVEEGLRRGAIATHLLRVSTTDVQISGVPIPAGSKLMVAIAAANADAEKFPEPLRFDVHRHNAGDHLAFGIGRHFCMGALLGRLEARIALEELYRRLPGLRTHDDDMEFIPAITVRPLKSLRATWDPS